LHKILPASKGGIVKIQHLFLMLFFAAYTLAASAVEFQVSGTVIKKGGGPLQGVAVLKVKRFPWSPERMEHSSLFRLLQ
jgi:hypothetical protein